MYGLASEAIWIVVLSNKRNYNCVPAVCFAVNATKLRADQLKSELDGHGCPRRSCSYFHPRLFFPLSFFFFFYNLSLHPSSIRCFLSRVRSKWISSLIPTLLVLLCVCVSRQIPSWNQGIESMRAAIWSHTHLSMKQEIMADGPRCKRRKQANPRRKNGKKITGASIGWDIFGCTPGLKLSTAVRGCVRLRGWCAFLPLRRDKGTVIRG